MPFNFIAHHSCRHCSGHLFYSSGKCYGEAEGGDRRGERNGLAEGWVLRARLWTGSVGNAVLRPLQAQHQERKIQEGGRP